MPTKSKPKPISTLISLRLPTAMLDTIDEHATTTKDRSHHIRAAIERYIQEVLCEAI